MANPKKPITFVVRKGGSFTTAPKEEKTEKSSTESDENDTDRTEKDTAQKEKPGISKATSYLAYWAPRYSVQLACEEFNLEPKFTADFPEPVIDYLNNNMISEKVRELMKEYIEENLEAKTEPSPADNNSNRSDNSAEGPEMPAQPNNDIDEMLKSISDGLQEIQDTAYVPETWEDSYTQNEKRAEAHQKAILKTVTAMQTFLDRLTNCEINIENHSGIIHNLMKSVRDIELNGTKAIDELRNLIKDVKGGSGTSGIKVVTIKPNGNQSAELKDVVTPKEFPTILQCVSQRLNIMLTGPTGCGKTFVSDLVAKSLGLEYYSISCSEGMSESEFKGWLLPLGDSGKFIYTPSDFITAYENGGVFCADEFDAIDPNCAVFINKALSSNSFHLPQRVGNTLVKKHEDFIWIACANTMGEGADSKFVGRNQLDASTLDRHRSGMVELDYDPTVESAICDKDVLLWGRVTRKALKVINYYGRSMSTRFLVEMSKMKLAYGWGIAKWEEAFLRGLPENLVTKIKNASRDVASEILKGTR